MKIHPLQIDQLRSKNYPGGDIEILETHEEERYTYHIVEYPSEGLKIQAVIAIPSGESPKDGWPLIIFNRGFVPNEDYKIDKQYKRYWEFLVKAGFAIFKSDYRGIGRSEGEPASPAKRGEQARNLVPSNSTDVLNGLASLQNYQSNVIARPRSGEAISQKIATSSTAPRDDTIVIDFNRVGIWGHSMGAQVSLQCMLANDIFKAGALWCGFFIPADQMIKRWQESDDPKRIEQAQKMIEEFGDPSENIEFYQSISPILHLNELPGPIQVHHGKLDDKVPYEDSIRLEEELKKVGKSGGLFVYEKGGHNLNEEGVLPEAMHKTIEFFQKYI